MIGAIGSKSLDDVIMFEVSPDKILTLDNFVRRNSVRFAKNNVLLRKPVSQYTGPDLDTIRFSINLKAQFGVNPKAEYDKLVHIQREGLILTILIGTTVFGVYRWRIANLSIPQDIIDNKGFCVSSTVDVSFEEYV